MMFNSLCGGCPSSKALVKLEARPVSGMDGLKALQQLLFGLGP